MKYFFVWMMWLVTVSYAGMIEYRDDDRYQWITFENCDPDSVDHVIIGVSLFPDSGFVEYTHQLTDSLQFANFDFIAPDYDDDGRLIPGERYGEYWHYVIPVLMNGTQISPSDTGHTIVQYINYPGCAGLYHVD